MSDKMPENADSLEAGNNEIGRATPDRRVTLDNRLWHGWLPTVQPTQRSGSTISHTHR